MESESVEQGGRPGSLLSHCPVLRPTSATPFSELQASGLDSFLLTELAQ